MHDFLVDMLMHCAPPEFHRLHQFIQFQAIASQVSTAFQLLKVEDRWPPSFQLAMDMLSKLKAYAEMIEVYLARGMWVTARAGVGGGEGGLGRLRRDVPSVFCPPPFGGGEVEVRRCSQFFAISPFSAVFRSFL